MKIKSLLICLIAVVTIAFSSCKPDPITDPENYTEDFVGKYTMTMTASWTLVDLEGIKLDAVGTTDCEVVEVSDNNVKIYIYNGSKIDCTINGKCDENGLHLENFEYLYIESEYLEDYGYQLTMAFDLLFGGVTVDRQYNGNISWESPIIMGSLELAAYGETVDGGRIIGNMSFMGVKKS